MSAATSSRPIPVPTKLPAPCVALVTDRRVSGSIDALLAAVEAAVAGGVSLVQMREKDLPDAEQLVLARRLRELTAGRALLFVNDSVSIAQAAGADGVQLAERSRTVASALDAMALDDLGRGRLLVGRSVHDLAGATDGTIAAARHDFEGPWNRLHYIRSTLSVLVVALASVAALTPSED